MKLSATLLAASTAVLGAEAFTVPRTARVRTSFTERTLPPRENSGGAASPAVRLSHHSIKTKSPAPGFPGAHIKALSDPTAESVQGGAYILVDNANSSDFWAVSGSFRIPTASMPTEGPTANNTVGSYAATFWIGIDGIDGAPGPAGNCDDVSLRAGIDISFDPRFGGELEPFAWYQWLPEESFGYENFKASPGDEIRINVTVTGSTAGSVSIENLGPATPASNDDTVPTYGAPAPEKAAADPIVASHTFSNMTTPLCQAAAAWVIEDFPMRGLPDVPIPLVNFTDVTFGAMQILRTGNTAEIGSIFNIVQAEQGGRLTDCRNNEGAIACSRVLVGNGTTSA